MKKVADIACASSFIEEMPDKYNALLLKEGRMSQVGKSKEFVSLEP